MRNALSACTPGLGGCALPFGQENGGLALVMVYLPDVVVMCQGGGTEQERNICLYSLECELLCLTSLGVHSPLFPSNESVFVLPYHVWMHIAGN